MFKVPTMSSKLRKTLLISILGLNVVVIVGILDYLGNFSSIDYNDITQYTMAQPWLGNEEPEAPQDFDNSGYIIEPNNVQFKFINPKHKSGNPKDILRQNTKYFQTFFEHPISKPKDVNIESIRPPKDPNDYVKANATIVALVRNIELNKIGNSVRRLDQIFNNKFKYPYTFINDAPFNKRFKERIASYTDAPVEFVTIPPELWNKPSFIDHERERKAMNELQQKNIAYAKKQSYHNMCRFYLGNFFNLPQLKKYRYYWRLEPNVNFFNEINYDVFKYLELTGKIYGFTVNLYDIDDTIKTLWPTTLKFLNEKDHYKYVNKNGAFQWILENQQNPQKNENTGGYSTCHFWSNFEIGDMDFFRSEAYMEWFKYLDREGGFYYERWGDAPVHSLGLGLFADKSKIHWFRDIGYFHDPYMNCPNVKSKLDCEPGTFSRWKHLQDQNCMASWIDYAMDEPNIY